MFEINNLSLFVSADFSLKNICFKLPENTIFTLVGTSGSGKSTLLRCLAGLERYQVTAEIKPSRMGFVFQSSNLFSHLTLEENIKLALRKVQKKSSAEAEQICEQVLSKVKLHQRRNSYPHQLSGGQQQRGTIARALALNPQVILYDEPTSSLDPELVDEILELMLDLKKSGITQIVATHEKEAVNKISDYVGFMNNGTMRLFEKHAAVGPKIEEMTLAEQKYLRLFL